MRGNAVLDLIIALLLRITRCRCRTVSRQCDCHHERHETAGNPQADHAKPGGTLSCGEGREFDRR